MDISAYLASVQDNPQSAMLARNVMQPGIPSPDGSTAPDAGALPQPSWSDQAQDMSQAQDTGPVTGGFDQAQMGMDAPLPDMGQDNLDQGMQSFNDQPPEDTQEEDQGYARGGMVRQPRMPKVKTPRARKPKAGGGGGAGGSGLWSGETPDENQPAGTISDFGMYDKNHNLLGITDLGITRDQVMGTTNKNPDAGMWEGAGPAGDSSGAPSGDVGGGNLPVGAEGGSVDEMVELSDDKGDDQYARLPRADDNVDDRRRDVITPQEYAGMSAHEQAMASNYPGGPGDDMLAGSKRLLKGPMKFDEGGDVEDPLVAQAETPAPAIPEPGEGGGDMPGIPPVEGEAPPVPDKGEAEAVDAGLKEVYRQNGVNTGVPDPSTEQRVRAMMQGKGATPPDQAEAAIEANGGNAGKAVKSVFDFFNKGSGKGGMSALGGDADFGTATSAMGQGAAAAAGMIQHVRTVWNKASALASAAADGGNMPKAAEALQVALDKGVPDGTRVQVAPTQGGVDVSVDGKNTPLTPQQMHHIAATPFDVIAHMGVPQTLANLQNVQQLQHPSGQPQQPVPPQPLPQRGAGTRAPTSVEQAIKEKYAGNKYHPDGLIADPLGKTILTGREDAGPPQDWPGKSQGYHQEQSEAGRAQVRASRDQGQPGVPVSADEPLPESIKMVRGPYTTGGGRRGAPVTMHGQSSERVDARTGDVIPNETPQERVANIAAKARTGQEQIRQQGLNTRAADGASSPHGREAQLKMQRERQALTAANAELKEAADAGKPVDRAAIYKKYGLEHLLAGAGGGAPAAGATPKDGEIRVINGRKMRADVQKGGWVPAE